MAPVIYSLLVYTLSAHADPIIPISGPPLISNQVFITIEFLAFVEPLERHIIGTKENSVPLAYTRSLPIVVTMMFLNLLWPAMVQNFTAVPDAVTISIDPPEPSTS